MSKRTPFEKTLTSQAHYPDQYFFQLIQTPLFQVQNRVQPTDCLQIFFSIFISFYANRSSDSLQQVASKLVASKQDEEKLLYVCLHVIS